MDLPTKLKPSTSGLQNLQRRNERVSIILGERLKIDNERGQTNRTKGQTAKRQKTKDKTRTAGRSKTLASEAGIIDRNKIIIGIIIIGGGKDRSVVKNVWDINDENHHVRRKSGHQTHA